MPRHPASVCLLIAALLAATATAQVVHVPGDIADLQTALDAAAPDDVIVVHGGTWGPLVITTPVRLVGSPAPEAPFIVGGGPGPDYASPITLAGPGGGVVRLTGLTLGGTISPQSYSGGAAALEGGGFDALHLIDCYVRGPTWSASLSQTPGESGVDVDLPRVVVERCRIRASRPASFDCADDAPDGAAALRSTGTVLLVDARITGAGGAQQCTGRSGGGCPDPPPGGGAGGPGVVCPLLLHADSELGGGAGTVFTDFDRQVVCHVAPDGEAIVADEVHVLPHVLFSTPSPPVGGRLTLVWDAPGPSVLLWASAFVTHPVLVPGLGWLVLDPDLAVLVAVLPNAGSSTWDLPADASLVGAEIGLQLLAGDGTLSRPALLSIIP